MLETEPNFIINISHVSDFWKILQMSYDLKYYHPFSYADSF